MTWQERWIIFKKKYLSNHSSFYLYPKEETIGYYKQFISEERQRVLEEAIKEIKYMQDCFEYPMRTENCHPEDPAWRNIEAKYSMLNDVIKVLQDMGEV
jgi:hypothetical protein